MVLQFFFQNVGPGIACDVDFEVIKDSEAGDFGRQPETVELALAKKSYEDTCTRPKNTLRGYEISSRASLKKLVRSKVAQDVRIRRAAETKGSHIKHHSLVYRTAYSLYRRVNTEDSALEGRFRIFPGCFLTLCRIRDNDKEGKRNHDGPICSLRS
jgi:hypothetical protein